MVKGCAWVFDNVVVFDSIPLQRTPLSLGKRLKSQLGDFLGLIVADVPLDPFCITYERLHHTKAWLKRHPEDRFKNQCLYDFMKFDRETTSQ